MDWRSIVGGIAPTIGAALGGPAGGIAVKFLADKLLGKPGATEAEISAAVKDMPPTMQVELKRLEIEFKKHAAEIGLDLERLQVEREKIAAQDRDSARNRQIQLRDNTPQYLAYLYTFAFFVVLGVQFYMGIIGKDFPKEVLRTIDVTTGVLFAFVLASKDYFLGSSASSKSKDDQIKHMWDTSP